MTVVASTDTERPRCSWATSAPEYAAYHDDEWGVPLHGDNEMFERMSLEAFQSGLSWITILRKREAFRAAFGRFDLATVADFDESDADRLMADAGIVRNRQKIDAVLSNARIALEVDGGLSELLWSYAPEHHERPRTAADVPAVSPGSIAMAKGLKKRGFRFVGPTTAYALMQATGMVDDHIATCWRATASPDPTPPRRQQARSTITDGSADHQRRSATGIPPDVGRCAPAAPVLDDDTRQR